LLFGWQSLNPKNSIVVELLVKFTSSARLTMFFAAGLFESFKKHTSTLAPGQAYPLFARACASESEVASPVPSPLRHAAAPMPTNNESQSATIEFMVIPLKFSVVSEYPQKMLSILLDWMG
jgi:hypothetical protein